MRLWIRNPLGIVAEAAAGGVVVEGAVIAELVAAGAAPAAPVDEVFDASAHVVLPGLINTHHHFYQTLTRAHPAAIDRELFPWLTALYPLWARLTPRICASPSGRRWRSCCSRLHHGGRPSLPLSAGAGGCRRHRSRRGARARHPRDDLARLDEPVAEGWRLPPDTVVQDEDTILADSERVLNCSMIPRRAA